MIIHFVNDIFGGKFVAGIDREKSGCDHSVATAASDMDAHGFQIQGVGNDIFSQKYG